jgi:glycosyltransferase involved in cell wall biosynthesis
MDKVSCIIPTHNRAEFLKAAVTSALAQSYANLEVIVVDDASTDNTTEVVDCFNDSRITYLLHSSNRGGSAARNTGILASASEYVAFLDDDDEWLAEKIAKQMNVLQSSAPEVGCVYTGYWDVDRRSGSIVGKKIPCKRGDLAKELQLENCIGSASSVLVKRKCLNDAGLFDESLPCSQDYDLWLRLSKLCYFECVQEPLFKYHIHDRKITTNPVARAKGLAIMKAKYQRAGSPISSRYFGNVYSDLGISYCLAGDTKVGRKAFAEAIRSAPTHIRGYLNLCLSLLGAKNFRRVKQIEQKIASFTYKATT